MQSTLASLDCNTMANNAGERSDTAAIGAWETLHILRWSILTSLMYSVLSKRGEALSPGKRWRRLLPCASRPPRSLYERYSNYYITYTSF